MSLSLDSISPSGLVRSNSRRASACEPVVTLLAPPNQQTIRHRTRLGPGRRLRYGAWLGPALLLLVWTLASATGLLDHRVLSEPWIVVATAAELIVDGRLPAHLLTSAQRAFLGLGLGLVTGTLLALASGLSRSGEALLDGPIQIKRSIPTLALIPLFIAWFGIGE